VEGGGRRGSVVGLETLPLTKPGQMAVNTILGGLEGEFLVSGGTALCMQLLYVSGQVPSCAEAMKYL
jgi:hypothetical protein